VQIGWTRGADRESEKEWGSADRKEMACFRSRYRTGVNRRRGKNGREGRKVRNRKGKGKEKRRKW